MDMDNISRRVRVVATGVRVRRRERPEPSGAFVEKLLTAELNVLRIGGRIGKAMKVSPETFRFIQVDIEPDAIIHGGDPSRRDVRVGVVGR
jgi:hypothetical protein